MGAFARGYVAGCLLTLVGYSLGLLAVAVLRSF